MSPWKKEHLQVDLGVLLHFACTSKQQVDSAGKEDYSSNHTSVDDLETWST